MMKKVTKKQVEEKQSVFCKDCAFATPDLKFENLSLSGKPTLLYCERHPFPKRLINQEGCNDYKAKI